MEAIIELQAHRADLDALSFRPGRLRVSGVVTRMSEQVDIPKPPPLTEEQEALLRRCCPVRKISDDEIVFQIQNIGLGKAAWLTFVWALWLLAPVSCGWVADTPWVTWVYLGIVPTFLLTWLVAWAPAWLVLARGYRSMTTVLRDGRWTIQLPPGSSPTDWGFPTASVPFRPQSDEVERVEAWEILQRFTGSDLSKKTEDSPLAGLLACGADVLGYDETSISLANFTSARSWVIGIGATMIVGLPWLACFVFMFSPFLGGPATLLAGTLGLLGALLIARDGRESSVATFMKGKREVLLFRRGLRSTFDINEKLIRVVGDGDGGEFVVVPDVYSCAPYAGTANDLVTYLQTYLAPEKKRPPPYSGKLNSAGPAVG